ncbi:hypothetical protein [Nitrosomonas supralitoralis]|uniref:Uncharacterized protein n=1 Tax=Nitrosomonas supralitoralis TaxID=2116706 RepID=A0A2P7NZT9_9PROT|nr:hypothetical protein [Nitrosomonas supralitoralis]PSJ18958.1 hypothetical protein C7H79_00555 [Nitrosomonas supralitoralis]
MKKSFLMWMVLVFYCWCISAVSARDYYYDRLLNPNEFKKLDNYTVSQMQQNLATIYQNNRHWMRDVAQSRHPLTDGRMGPVTLFWLQRFIKDFKIEPIGSYVHETILRLEDIASFANMFPEETKILISHDFSYWNDDRPELQMYHYYSVRRDGTHQALLDLVHLYQQIIDPLPDSAKINKNKFITYYYQLTAEDFKVLQDKNQIHEQLSKLENKQFDNISALKEAVSAALKDYPDQLDQLMSVIQRYYRYADPVISQSFIDVLKGDPLFTSLNSVLADLLDKTISDVAYPDKHLFEQAVKSKIYAGIGACQHDDQQNDYVLNLKINDKNFKKLIEDLLTGPYEGIHDFSNRLKIIDQLRMPQKDKCKEADLESIDKFVTDLYVSVVHPAIASLYKKNPIYSEAMPVQWDGRGCGCVLNDLSGTVYGFYPFWLANGETQTVNFSVLSRVAYYGLSFDENGAIMQANSQHNQKTVLSTDETIRASQIAFVQVARKYTSKVDWVIHNDKPYWNWWKTQSIETKATILKTLTEDIVHLLNRQITNHFSQIGQNITFGAVTAPTQGDGITLYFNDFPGDPDSIAIFNRFFADLQKRLFAAKHDYFVNILVPQSVLGKGLYRYSNILSWVDDTKISSVNAGSLLSSSQNENLKTKILVLIEEPTTNAKKKLRFDIEHSELHGVERGLLLRNIIPVIQFDGRNWKQLEDDVVYFKDNFGGIGFWPLMIDKPETAEKMPLRYDDIKSVSGYVVRFFQASTWRGDGDSFIDKFVCENRIYFRMSLNFMTIVCVLLAGLYFYSCRIRYRIKNYYVLYLSILIIPTLIIALLLLTYDPVLEPISKGNLPLILILFGGAAISIIFYQSWKKQMKKPSRPRMQLSSNGQVD